MSRRTRSVIILVDTGVFSAGLARKPRRISPPTRRGTQPAQVVDQIQPLIGPARADRPSQRITNGVHGTAFGSGSGTLEWSARRVLSVAKLRVGQEAYQLSGVAQSLDDYGAAPAHRHSDVFCAAQAHRAICAGTTARARGPLRDAPQP